jgi:hypothetical protein
VGVQQLKRISVGRERVCEDVGATVRRLPPHNQCSGQRWQGRVIAEAFAVVEHRLLRIRRLIQEAEIANRATRIDRRSTGFAALTRAAFTGVTAVRFAAL